MKKTSDLIGKSYACLVKSCLLEKEGGGTTDMPSVRGVDEGVGYGVRGRSINGFGLYGESYTGYGVFGSSDSLAGVYGVSDSGKGVHGYSSSGNGVVGWSERGMGVVYLLACSS
jgi:hypothetical protein